MKSFEGNLQFSCIWFYENCKNLNIILCTKEQNSFKHSAKYAGELEDEIHRGAQPRTV